MSENLLTFLARWALLHELADDAWRGAVARGRATGTSETPKEADASLDGLAALVADEKDALRSRLTERAETPSAEAAGTVATLEEIRFELGELRGRLESLETAITALDLRVQAGCNPLSPAQPEQK
ncbi:MAG: hypothetical protein GX604_07020 [Actinobacteria bacterium]|nr:hypothetical protein [Actinomycetota bacterium]